MKRSEFLRQLSREHHAALKLAKVCEQAGISEDLGAKCDRALQLFVAELEPHFCTEERDLIPLLNKELTTRLLEEHSLLRELASALPLHQASALQSFGRLLAAHVRFEERELFEFIEQRLKQNRVTPP